MKETITLRDIKRTTIYIQRDLDELFSQLCAREGVSKSQKISEWMFDYVNDHSQGPNPQTSLMRHLQPIFKKCDLCHHEFKFLTKAEMVSGLIRHLCDDCLVNEKKRCVVKKVICKV